MRTTVKSDRVVCICLMLLPAAIGCGASTNSETAAVPADDAEGHLQEPLADDARIVFLHHSTGEVIWNGGVPQWFETHNAERGTRYRISERNFPKDSPYGWENYPYDYWNIWVKHAGEEPFKEEPTLEMLTGEYDVIVFKHCFPVSDIDQDYGDADIASPDKRIENYKLQYTALRSKLREFPKNRFLVWTGAAQARECTEEQFAERAKEFSEWVVKKWDEPEDNVYVWDFRELETEGGLYLKNKHASDPYDSHPNEDFARVAAPLLCRRIVAVIEGRGDASGITGK